MSKCVNKKQKLPRACIHNKKLKSTVLPQAEGKGSIQNKRVNQKVKAIFKLRGNRDREELAHCAALTVPVEEFSHVQYSALPSVEWQQ